MIETYASAAALADAAAHAAIHGLERALATRGRASLVATGGRSPGPVYDRLAHDGRLDWARVVVTLSDERCVAPDDPRSNQRLLRERLLVGRAAKAHLLPLWPEPEPAALEVLQPFDVVMLGMGEDGHVASLFPAGPAEGLAGAPGRSTVEAPAGLGDPPVARISLTLPALSQARLVLVMIAGDRKRRVVEEAGADLPIHRLLAGADARVLWAPEHQG